MFGSIDEQNKRKIRSAMVLCSSRGIPKACFYFGGNGPAERERWIMQEGKLMERRVQREELVLKRSGSSPVSSKRDVLFLSSPFLLTLVFSHNLPASPLSHLPCHGFQC